MKRKCFLLCASAVTAFWLCGCVSTIDGRSQVGVPLVKDKVEYRYERSPQEIWTAAKDVLKYNGTLCSEDALKATLEASVDTRTVWVKVEPVDTKVSKVTVQARTKNGGADLALAGEIDKEIAVRLATGNLAPATRPSASAR